MDSHAETSGEEEKRKRVYDLAERTAAFGEAVIRFARSGPRSPVTDPLIRQVVKSGTGVGANYCEADEAGSRKEFKYRISVCKREAGEAKYWLRMIVAAHPPAKGGAAPLWKEADELQRIFATIHRNTRA